MLDLKTYAYSTRSYNHERRNEMSRGSVLLSLVLSFQMDIYSCNNSGIVIGVLQETSVFDRKLVDAAVDFVQHDFSEGATVWTNLSEVISVESGGSLLELATTVCGFLKQGIHGMIGHVDCPSAKVIANILSTHGVPAILVAPSYCDLILPPGVFRMKSKPAIFRYALDELLSPLWVTSEVIFYDKYIGPSFVEGLFLHGIDFWTTSILVEERLSWEQQELLIDISLTSKGTVFIVLLKPSAATQLLRLAVSLKLNTPFQTWVVVFDDPFSCSDIPSSEWAGGNLLLVSAHYRPLEQLPCPQELFHLQTHIPFNMTLNQAYVMDAYLIMANAISKDQTNQTVSTYATNSCVPSGRSAWVDGPRLIDQIQQTNFRGVSGPTRFRSDGYNTDTVVDFWAVDADAVTGRSLRAQWTAQRHLEKRYDPIIVNPPNNFRNRRLKVGVVQSAPYIILNYNKEKNPEFSGFCIEIVDVLSSVLNFTVEYVDGGEDYGTKVGRNGQWTGMIGKVMKGEVDFAAAAFSVTEDREKAVDFTIPFNQDSSAFLLKRPHEGQKVTRIFLPFNITVWCGIFTGVTLVGLILFAVRLGLRDRQSKVQQTGTDRPRSGVLRLLVDNLWFAYGTYVEQSMEQYPQCQSGRVLVVFWWLFTIIMSATYTANLVAYLTVSISDKPISTLQELADDPNVLPLILPGNSLNDLFSSPSASEVYKELWSQLQQVPRPLPNTTNQALSMVATGKYALFNDEGIIGYSAVKHCDEFVLADETFRTMGQAFALPKGSDYKRLFDTKIAQMQESGIIQKWHSRWWVPKPAGCDAGGLSSPASNWRHMNVESLAGAFLVLISAVAVSLLTLAAEIFVVHARQGGGWAPDGRNAPASDAA